MSCKDSETWTCLGQPPNFEYTTPDGIFLKPMILAQAGTLVPQHAHVYVHTSLLVAGSVRVWADGALLGDFVAPTAIHIPAKVKHKFLSLEPNTALVCIHNVEKTGSVQIHEEHQLDSAA